MAQAVPLFVVIVYIVISIFSTNRNTHLKTRCVLQTVEKPT